MITENKVTIGVLDTKLAWKDADRHLCQLLGIEWLQLQGKSFYDYLANPDDQQLIDTEMSDVISSSLDACGKEKSLQLQLVRHLPNGSSTIFESTVTFRRSKESCVLVQIIDNSQQEKNHELIQSIARITASLNGKQFFEAMVKKLAEAAEVDIAFIAQRNGNQKLRTLAVWNQGPTADFEYDLKGSPCEIIQNNQICFYSENAYRLFPNDTLLTELKIESLYGVAILDQMGQPTGLLMMMDRKPRQKFEELNSVLTFVAAHCSIEISHLNRQSHLTNQLQSQQSFSTTIIETSNSLLCVINKQGHILIFNKACEDLTGYTKAEVIGKNIFDILIPKEERSSVENESFLKLTQGNFPNTFENHWQSKDGNQYLILWRNSCTVDENGKVDLIISNGTDITRQKALEQDQQLLYLQLEHTFQETVWERDFRRQIIETTNAIFIIFDENGYILEFNLSAERISGYKREEVIGKRLEILTPKESQETELSEFLNRMKTRDIVNKERQWVTKSGKIVWIHWATSKLTHPHNGSTILIATGIDVTATKEANQNLSIAYSDLKELNDHLEDRVKERTAALEIANQELEGFSYSVSHDLRAPLRHISGFIDLINMKITDQFDPQIKRYIDIVGDSAKRLGLLIDELLQFSRMGRVEIHQRAVDLNSLIPEVIEELTEEINGQEIEWVIRSLPHVFGDASLIFLVLQNLISNAIKFSGKIKSPRIEIFAKETQSNIEIHVKDNGVGFDMQYADKLFGVFQRLHKVEDFEGTGIGLANVKRIIQRHGGQVSFYAEIDQGADFFFTLRRVT